MGNVICLNGISGVDTVFFIVCAVLIALIIGIYFLIPVFNKKLYRDQRENLHKREAAFKSNIDNAQSNEPETENQAEEVIPEVPTDE